MPTEILFWLRPSPDTVVLDCTVGYCGHAASILGSSAPTGRLIGIDRDPRAIYASEAQLCRFGGRLELVRGHFVDLKRHLADRGVLKVSGVLFDLGVSSPQLDEPARGLVFRRVAHSTCGWISPLEEPQRKSSTMRMKRTSPG